MRKNVARDFCRVSVRAAKILDKIFLPYRDYGYSHAQKCGIDNFAMFLDYFCNLPKYYVVAQ